MTPSSDSFQTTGDATGHRLPFTADWATTLTADYTPELGSVGDLDLNVTYNHNSGFYTETDNIRRQGAYNLVNASVIFTPAGSRFTIRAWAENLANEAIVTLLAGTAFGTGAQWPGSA